MFTRQMESEAGRGLKTKVTSNTPENFIGSTSKIYSEFRKFFRQKEYETNHKLGSTSRNEEHWKWNQARRLYTHAGAPLNKKKLQQENFHYVLLTRSVALETERNSSPACCPLLPVFPTPQI
ncbi:uncharacterized protein LOC118527162 isoform X2 [Halichoerus grypus]